MLNNLPAVESWKSITDHEDRNRKSKSFFLAEFPKSWINLRQIWIEKESDTQKLAAVQLNVDDYMCTDLNQLTMVPSAHRICGMVLVVDVTCPISVYYGVPRIRSVKRSGRKQASEDKRSTPDLSARTEWYHLTKFVVEQKRAPWDTDMNLNCLAGNEIWNFEELVLGCIDADYFYK